MERLSSVGVAGFEPTTLWSQTRCATGLRYTPRMVPCNWVEPPILSLCRVIIALAKALAINSGERGIRTLGTVYTVQRFSKPSLSATQASLLKRGKYTHSVHFCHFFSGFSKQKFFLPAIQSGERGIRTLGTLASTHAFQACSFSHSDISPVQSGTQKWQIIS